jgi:mevalonate kinase
MPAISASAPGKIILFGEHAVVFGRSAVAIPVTQVQAKVVVTANPGKACWIEAPGIGLESKLNNLPAEHPLALAVRSVQEKLGLDHLPAFRLKIVSTIPIAAGLGSGAAVSVAIARAVSTFVGQPLTDEQISAVAYTVDQVYHGTPSGIDNTVITYANPVMYTRGHPFERLIVAQPFTIVIGNTGVSTSTSDVVSDLRRRWVEAPNAFEPHFNRIGAIAREARRLIELGRPEEMGPLMNSNHSLLRQIDVSSVELNHLVDAALKAGALGAKMSGGGRGGNMIALVRAEKAENIAQALREAGATETIVTQVS